MTVPSESEEMHILPRENPPPRLLATAISKTPPSIPDGPRTDTAPTESRSRWRFVAIFLVVIAAVTVSALAVKYWLPREKAPPSDRPTSVLKPIGQNLPAQSSPGLVVTADQLRVSAIALGDVRLAIVNGKRLEEGDWLDLQTPQGVATLRVIKIDDGVVHFRYAGEVIDAKLAADPSTKSPR